ncbi:hemolysins and related protein [Candidatus Scalindua japonica]|uniref:Hemolysins and related protein n=1 Tax=Candidatus Scalindua japonica TaxID=1284222 RepID=A0A286U0K7_9BACT|nr:CNNM domain-containing protein [Candidatus Scalindua japonica]GAX61667.1 hemolysins and related protein [Candidatus Scalindua japonica]
MTEYYLLIIFILFSAYFSGIEIAVYCINHVRLQYNVEKGIGSAKTIKKLLNDPQALICTILIGNNIVNYLASAIFTNIISKKDFHANPELVATLVLAPIILIFAEVLPKDICQRNADKFLYPASTGIRFFSYIFSPLVYILKWANRIPQLFLKNVSKRTAIFTPYRLGFFIREGAKEGVISGYQDMMTRNIMKMGSIPVRKIMIPLSKATVVSSDVNFEQMKILATNVRFSRIPVYKGPKSNIIGIINLFDFLSVCTEDSKIYEFLKDAEHISAETLIDDALVRMQNTKQRMAVVVDKSKKPIGIVTIKDLVEEIVGELMEW